MTISQVFLLRSAVWTAMSFGVNQALRVMTNIILARLLAPELFGIMQIVNSLRIGIELISDVGVSQNIVYSKHANEPDFYNTAWTLQLVRGILLWLALCAAAIPMAKFYRLPILGPVVPVTGFITVLSGFTSTSICLLQKRMQYRTLTVFNMIVGVASAALSIIVAYFNRTIWALVFGYLAGTTISMIGSFFVLPEIRQKLHIARRYVVEILSFGKWIFASSIIYFCSSNFDRLYLAKAVPLALLGVYGIARALADVLSGLVLQLGHYVIFPIIASNSHVGRAELRAQIASLRMKFLLVASFGTSLLAATADIAIRVLYDQRYHAASWMLPILIIGAWFAVISNVNEFTLLGIGRPQYGAFANSAKFAFLLIGMVLAVSHYGIAGGVVAVAASDLCRYMSTLVGQIRERLSFYWQDAVVTVLLFTLIAFWEWLRWSMGFGTSFDLFPLETLHTLGAK